MHSGNIHQNLYNLAVLLCLLKGRQQQDYAGVCLLFLNYPEQSLFWSLCDKCDVIQVCLYADVYMQMLRTLCLPEGMKLYEHVQSPHSFPHIYIQIKQLRTRHLLSEPHISQVLRSIGTCD